MLIVRNVLAVIGGWFIGSIVNMSLINLGHNQMPIEGLDVNDMEAYAALIPALSAEYFIFPFLAHALGTFVGAIAASLIAGSKKKTFALVIGVVFLLGGILVNLMLSGPIWFTLLDILVAYIPMAWLGWFLTNKLFLSKIK